MAEDDKTFPGALCQPETNSLSILRDDQGRMFNTGTVPQLWTCPIVRDYPRRNLESAQIVVIDNNVALGDPNVFCTIFSKTSTGGPVSSPVSPLSFTTGAPGTTTLNYAVGDPDIIGANGGYYYFRCFIPGTFSGLSSGVVSYRISENE